MVKGTSKRVIVVRSPDPRFFEQAVFFLRDEALQRQDVTPEQILEEAGSVASCYLANHPPLVRRLRRLPPLFWVGLGAVVPGLLWLMTTLI